MDIIKKNGKEYLDFGDGVEIEITGYNKLIDEETKEVFGVVPQISMPEDADYRWQLDCLKSRFEHPKYYADTENVPEVIERLKQWLFDYEEMHPDIKALRAVEKLPFVLIFNCLSYGFLPAIK